MKSVRYLIFGRVQGVAYRAFARDLAQQLGVAGWVRNRPDGSVECVAAADGEVLRFFEIELKKGPRWGRVDKIEIYECRQAFDSSIFKIRY